MTSNAIRRYVLASLLLATLVATYFAPKMNDPNVVLPSERAAPAGRQSASAPSSAPLAADTIVQKLRSRQAADSELAAPSLFYVAPPPAPPAPVQVPVARAKPVALVESLPPQAPPLPFQFMGEYVEDGNTAYFLQYNSTYVVARTGDVLAGTYKVEGIQGNDLVLRYIPLNQAQTLPIR